MLKDGGALANIFCDCSQALPILGCTTKENVGRDSWRGIANVLQSCILYVPRFNGGYRGELAKWSQNHVL